MLCTESEKYSTEIVDLRKNKEDLTAEKEKQGTQNSRSCFMRLEFVENGWSQVSDMVNGINLYINTCKDFLREKDETCVKLVENSDKTMNYENYVSDMNGMQEEISSLSELFKQQ